VGARSPISYAYNIQLFWPEKPTRSSNSQSFWSIYFDIRAVRISDWRPGTHGSASALRKRRRGAGRPPCGANGRAALAISTSNEMSSLHRGRTLATGSNPVCATKASGIFVFALQALPHLLGSPS